MQVSHKVSEHFDSPVNVGSFDKNDPDIGTGLVGSPACGDVVRIQMKIKDGVIIDTRFKAFGCDSAIAATSHTVKMLIGKTIEQAKNVTNQEIASYLDLTKIKIHCSVLAREAIEAAVIDYNKKQSSLT